jgi:hypothetical protein
MGAISVFGGVDELGVVLDGVINLSDNIIKYNVVKGTSFDNGCGGGIYIVNCSPKINNNIITGNSTVGYGGGIYVSNGPTVAELTIINNTLINNSAQYGGGISVYSENALKTLLHLDNSILWGNIAVTSGSQIYKQSGTLTVNYSDIQGGGFEGAGNIDSDPMLKDAR